MLIVTSSLHAFACCLISLFGREERRLRGTTPAPRPGLAGWTRIEVQGGAQVCWNIFLDRKPWNNLVRIPKVEGVLHSRLNTLLAVIMSPSKQFPTNKKGYATGNSLRRHF